MAKKKSSKKAKRTLPTRRTEPGREREYLTTEEVADLLRLSPSAVAQWRIHQKAGGPPFIKIGHRVLYDRAALKEWIRSRTIQY